MQIHSKYSNTFRRQRPYHVENTASRPISEVKQRRVWSVLGWVTAWEHQMLLAFYHFHILFFFIFYFIFSDMTDLIKLWDLINLIKFLIFLKTFCFLNILLWDFLQHYCFISTIDWLQINLKILVKNFFNFC